MNDLRLVGATIIDGTGGPPRRGDIAVRDRSIVAVGDDAGAPAQRTIDLDGLVLAPGFIDLHTHVDFTLPRFPRAAAMIRQGVTTLVGGNCGFSPFPVDAAHADDLRDHAAFLEAGITWDWDDAAGYLRMLDGLPLASNFAPLVGHGAVRIAVMGYEQRAPHGEELARMCELVGDALDAGAFGLSTGLVYAPGHDAGTEEITVLARVAASRGAWYASHVRNEGDTLEQAVGEALTIGRRAGAAVQLSHHKAMGQANWGKVRRTLAMIDGARHDRLDVTADQYPYTAASTTLSSLLPRRAKAAGLEGMLALLNDPADRALLVDDMRADPSVHLDDVVISSVPSVRNAHAAGRNLTDVARDAGEEPFETLFRLLSEERDRVAMVAFGMDERDVRMVMRHPQVAVASDGWILDPSAGGAPHPRNYGTFVRVLGRYVREQSVLPLVEAVRKMTALPARRLGLTDRGIIRAGARADLVAFDPDRVTDTATFDKPHQFSEGVHLVVVNGHIVIEDGDDSGVGAGEVLRSGV